MLPHTREGQFELFSLDEQPRAAAPHSPRYELPFQRSEEVDIARIARILGVNRCTVFRLLDADLIRSYKLPAGKRRIEYNSVVEYCDRLRVEYRISARAVRPLRGRRHRDEDLLPFPLVDTIGIAEVREALDCTHTSALYMLEEGKLVGYQVFIRRRGCPWRISRTSLERYIESLRQRVASSRQESRPSL